MWKRLIQELTDEGFPPTTIYMATGVSNASLSRILSGKQLHPSVLGGIKLLALHHQQFPGQYQGKSYTKVLETLCDELDINLSEVSRFQLVDLSMYKLVPRPKVNGTATKPPSKKKRAPRG